MRRDKVLLKILETGSYTRAAEILGYTQPAVSQMIASLEREIGITLLRRSRYGVRLTPEGERLLPKIRDAVCQYDALHRAEEEIRGLESGLVRVGTVSSISCHRLPAVVERFWRDYPGVQLEFRQGDYSSICEWVRTGEVDFGFAVPSAARGLQARVLWRDPFVAVLPKDHPLARSASVSLSELETEPLLLLEEGCYSEPLEAFRQAGLAPDVRLAMHDDYSILSMVERGLGYSLLAELVLRRTSYDVAVLPTEERIVRQMALVTKDVASLSVAARRFIDYLEVPA